MFWRTWYSMPVLETCTVHRQRVTSNQYLDFSFIRHTSIHDDSVLVCLSAATLVYFCYCCLQGGRRDGLSFQIEGLAVSLFLSLSRFLAVDASSSSWTTFRLVKTAVERGRTDGRTDGRAVYRQDVRRMFEEEIERPGRLPVIRDVWEQDSVSPVWTPSKRLRSPSSPRIDHAHTSSNTVLFPPSRPAPPCASALNRRQILPVAVAYTRLKGRRKEGKREREGWRNKNHVVDEERGREGT